jgi:hypothetical protein
MDLQKQPYGAGESVRVVIYPVKQTTIFHQLPNYLILESNLESVWNYENLQHSTFFLPTDWVKYKTKRE